MIQLTALEARVLGVLVEKAQTTPQQYPMSLNGLVVGCNQKNNRAPVLSLSEDDVMEAVDGLREKGVVREVDLSGSRVIKFRHVARDVFEIGTNELVILAELLLRGPQTAGELRGRADRLHAMESTDVVKAIVDRLASREPPLVREIPAAPGSRAVRYEQLLSPNLHPVAVAAPGTDRSVTAAPASPDVARRVEALERRVAELSTAVARLEAAMAATSR